MKINLFVGKKKKKHVLEPTLEFMDQTLALSQLVCILNMFLR